MKLAFLIYSYFPYGGQQRDFRRIVQEAISRAHEVTIYALKWQGERLQGAELRIVPARAFRRLALYRKFTDRVLQDLAGNPCDAVVGFNKMPGLDIYFAADPCFAEKAARQRAAYYRFTPRYRHFMQYEDAVFGSASRTRALILSPLQRMAFEAYYPGCADRLHQVPPGVDRDRMLASDAEQIRHRFREEFGLASDTLLILQVGSGFRVKGVDRSLRAIAALPSPLLERVRYLLIGQDKPGRYLRMAAKLGIRDRFEVLPGRDDIPRFLLGADLLLHPAYSESAGYVLLEATIAGLPVLTTSTCGYAFHVQQAGSGLVCGEPFSQSELNARLLYMLTSAEREAWTRQGKEYGRRDELYSLPRVAVDLIENLAPRRGAA